MKIIEITWEDSGSNKEIWCDKDDYCNEPALCKTVGYLVEKNKTSYVLAQSDGIEQWGNVFLIPHGAIKKIRTLK
jgi:hypothetical protein